MTAPARLGLDTPIRRLSPADQREMRRVVKAADMYLDRQYRTVHPDGEFDSGGRWYPDDAEWQPCCAYVRSPSRAWPYSKMVHCRTAEHVASLTDTDAALVAKVARLAVKGDDSVADMFLVVEKFGVEVAAPVAKSAMPATEVLRRRKMTRRILRDAVAAPVATAA